MTEQENQREDFWNFDCVTKDYGLFQPHESAYLKKVPGGWLIRCLFVRGSRFTRSAIIFFPDSKSKWSDKNSDITWELLKNDSNPNYRTILHRLKVPEGWVIKEFLTTTHSSSSEGSTGLSLTYIPDPQHKWKIQNEQSSI
jgi:hypothetical protein